MEDFFIAVICSMFRFFVTWLASFVALLSALGYFGVRLSRYATENPEALKDFVYGVGRILGMPDVGP